MLIIIVTVFNPTDCFEMEKIINDMKDKAGWHLNGKVIKCIAGDIVPDCKSSNKHLTRSYRPISLIFNLAKIFEKIVYNSLHDFCLINKLISPRQYGFTKKTGNNDAPDFTAQYTFNNIDKNITTALVFINLAKVFDIINQKMLLKKL